MERAHFTLFIAILVMTAFPSGLRAEEEPDFLSFDQILQDLSRPKSISKQVQAPGSFSLNEVKLHTALGVGASSFKYINQRGVEQELFADQFEMRMGIDLLSPFWIAEGAFRSGREQKAETIRVKIQEFDLRVIHRIRTLQTLAPQGRDKFYVRAGLGLSGRTLTVAEVPKADSSRRFQTPTGLVLLGLQSQFTQTISLLVDLVYRSNLIKENPDRDGLESTALIQFTY